MGRRGPPPLPTAVKSARGTLRPDRTNPDEPRVVVCEPEMPTGLEAPARARWRHWCAVLLDLGVLSAECGPALESLVRAELRVRAARRAVAKFGALTKDGLERSAAARELDAAESEFRRWCTEFGATPAARSRVRATKPSAPAKPTAREQAKRRFFGGGEGVAHGA